MPFKQSKLSDASKNTPPLILGITGKEEKMKCKLYLASTEYLTETGRAKTGSKIR